MNKLFLRAAKAAVSGATTALTTIVVDPEHFNVSTAGGWKRVGIMVGVSALMREASFLKWWSETSNGGSNGPKVVNLPPAA